MKKTSPLAVALIPACFALFACGPDHAQAQQAGCVDCNRGVIQSHQAPESKKGTVLIDETSSADAPAAPVEELTGLQMQARVYREQGYNWQRMGNLPQALAMYQKAIQVDPGYAVAYNDLGIIYEAQGMMDRAEDSYLQALKLSPHYLSVCTNLALFYENRRDLQKAKEYWQKRAEFGSDGDPWTEKARRRLEDIRLVLGETAQDTREQDVIDLMKNVAVQKSVLKYDERALAKMYFDNAKTSYQRDDYVTAMKLASDAHLLDPSDKSIVEFIEKLQTRLLSR